MRLLVISYITEMLQTYTDLMWELDISPDELESLSNAELLDLVIEITEIVS
jgi:hypothetical protein